MKVVMKVAVAELQIFSQHGSLKDYREGCTRAENMACLVLKSGRCSSLPLYLELAHKALEYE